MKSFLTLCKPFLQKSEIEPCFFVKVPVRLARRSEAGHVFGSKLLARSVWQACRTSKAA